LLSDFIPASYPVYVFRALYLFKLRDSFTFILTLHLPPIPWVLAALSPGVKRPGREANYLPPSSAEVKNARSYTSISQYVFMV